MISYEFESGTSLPDLVSDIAERAGRIVARAADVIAESARDYLAPGSALRQSVSVAAVEDGYAVRADAPYAVYVEFGTSRMAARPFLGPAVDDLRGRLLENVT